MHRGFEEASLAMGRCRVYKGLLEAAVMVPFRRAGLLSKERMFPVLLDQVKVSVDRASSCGVWYVVDLEYGRQRWRVSTSVMQLFSLNAYLHYKGVMDLRRDKPDLCSGDEHRGVEEFLRTVLHRSRLLDIGKVYDFFRISRHSFSGERMFEDKFHVEVYRRTDACHGGRPCCRGPWASEKMYVVCKRSHLVLVDYKNGHEDVDVVFYRGDMDVEYKRHVFHSRVVIARGDTRYVIKSFRDDAVQQLAGEVVLGEERARGTGRVRSFSPVRQGSVVNFYVDGESYFGNLYETLWLARREVFIAGWWVHPRLYLVRRPKGGRLDGRYRLDRVLRRLAQQGVRVKILVYREVLGALGIDSGYTCEFLSGLHKRIEVIRHPNAVGHMPLYWSHHEKIVVVDQRVAYVGGMDLAPGRYDTQEHVPFGADSEEAGDSESSRGDVLEDRGDGCKQGPWEPRMPWHDVHCKIVGDSAFDVARHFIERWNFVVSSGGGTGRTSLLVPNEELVGGEGIGGARTQVLRSVGRWSLGTDEDSILRGYSEVIRGAKRFVYIENQFFITRCGDPDGCLENTVGRWLVERVVRAYRAGEEFKVYVVIPLFPAFEPGFMMSPGSAAMEIMRIQEQSISKGEGSLFQALWRHGIDPARYVVFMSLRKAGVVQGKVVQEQIYVHSKLIVGDGTCAVVGSANLNDRSMVGSRDTEIAVLVEEPGVQRLLRRLLCEHLCAEALPLRGRSRPLGFLEDHLLGDKLDLGSTDVFSRIVARAGENRDALEELSRVGAGQSTEECAEDVLARVQGHLVLFPWDTPVDERVEKSMFGIQGFIPSVVYY